MDSLTQTVKGVTSFLDENFKLTQDETLGDFYKFVLPDIVESSPPKSTNKISPPKHSKKT